MVALVLPPRAQTGLSQRIQRQHPIDRALAGLGDWLGAHRRTIRAVQWSMVGLYAFLLIAPAMLPIPERTAHIWSNLVLFAQFVFWGIWWPFVLLSMILVGRLWCGVLCPEGALSEEVSRKGKGLAVPRWITWKGWPFTAFACTTIYGQMVSVYQYALPALVVLGGSTLAAMAVGVLYGRDKRVWCRYLCPVSGVFGLLAKLAPVHFRVDEGAWSRWRKTPGGPQPMVSCAPLVPIRIMKGASGCHMCGRCSGYKGAITLARRSPGHEIVHVAGLEAKPWETVLIVIGLMGIAAGAFHWPSSAIFVGAKQFLAEQLVAHGILWPLEAHPPWWLLTDYPDQNDSMTILDGAVLIGFIFAAAALIGAGVSAFLALATAALGGWSWERFHHLAQALIPIAACGVFLGLSGLTVSMLRGEGLALDFIGLPRAGLLGGASFWSLTLAWGITGLTRPTLPQRCLAMSAMAGAGLIGAASWASLFWSL